MEKAGTIKKKTMTKANAAKKRTTTKKEIEKKTTNVNNNSIKKENVNAPKKEVIKKTNISTTKTVNNKTNNYSNTLKKTTEKELTKEKESKSLVNVDNKKKEKGKKLNLVSKIAIYFFSVLFLLLIFLTGTVLILEYGPSKTARNLFVNSAMESSAGKFLATLFISKDKIKEIQESNSVELMKEITDASLIAIDDTKDDLDKIELVKVKGSTFKGIMAIIHDPSRVTIGVSGPYGAAYAGKTVEEMAKSYNAVLATNGGGFEDANGMGNGGTPIGIVISDGKLAFGSMSKTYEVIGFDYDNKLVVGNMTGAEAINRGVRDALSFGPILIVNGKPAKINGTGGGLNPRTAIGQREDGAVLLLVIDGRQANSLGASYEDVMNVLLEYKAINAANLDGGSSSLLYYEGKYINNSSSLVGARPMPTSIIVR